MNRIRPAVQIGVFLLFVFLWTGSVPFFCSVVPHNFFLRIDPLVNLGILLASRSASPTMLWAAALILATLIGGRFFCGWACPLGTTLDLTDNAFRLKQRITKNKCRRLKYYFLALTLFSSLFGLTLFLFFDPISLSVRTLTLVFYPLGVFIANTLSYLVSPLLSKAGLFWYQSYSQSSFGLKTLLLTVTLILIIIGLSRIERRFWCRNLCPLGALLGLFARLALFKRTVSQEKCNGCSLCQQKCPMGAIDEDFHLLTEECNQCTICTSVCPQGAIDLRASISPTFGPVGFRPSRRLFFPSLAAAMGVGLAFLARPRPSAKRALRLLRPPGSLPEREFLDSCIRCGQCLKVCPTGGLQPVLWEDGFKGLGTPRLVPRRGGCEKHCNLCGPICPTGAIRRLPLEQKQKVKLGTAIIDRSRCIAWSENKSCLVCAEACPYVAVECRLPLRRPYVLADKCIGCGLCEQSCPVLGESAIVVYPEGF